MRKIRKYASFIKLEHTLFSLPLLFAGALMAERTWPSWRVIALILIAACAARVVALVLNRVIDKNIDRLNPRTKDRHLAAGTMNMFEAAVLALISLVIYLWAAWMLSDFCLKLSWIPLIGFAAYPYFKRFTKWAHVGLGIVWALVPLAGYFAVKPSLEGVAPVMLLGLFSIFWLAGFDIIYATMDEQFDREAGLYSLPSSWGSARALRMAGIFHVVSFVFLIALYGIWLAGPITVMLLVIVGILLLLEQKYSYNVDVAFLQMNVAIAFAVFLFVFSGIKGV